MTDDSVTPFVDTPRLLGPLLERGTITTLVGPADAEMAALVTALAVSYRTGRPLIPGFAPVGPSQVSVYPYSGTWIEWRVLASDICAANRLVPPQLYVRCFREPLITGLTTPRDPDETTFYRPLPERDVDADFAASKAAGHALPGVLTVTFNIEAAAGPGDDAVRQLYETLASDGKTVLMAGTEADVSWASEFGPVIDLPPLHWSVGWRDLLAIVTGGDRPERERVMVEHEEAVTPERSWAAAKERARDVAPPASGLGTLYGYGSVFNQWKEVNHSLEGRYLERIARGAFATAITERDRMKVLFRHGKDPRIGYRSLGPITVLEEDDFGVWYEVALVDGDHSWALVSGLSAGEFRSSFGSHVVADHLVARPGPTAHNPLGLPELTILEVRCSELGPCEHPAYAGTSAGIRLADSHSQPRGS